MKFGLKHLRTRTPDALFKLGNALVAVGGISSLGLIGASPTASTIICWCAIVGKFLCELFGEENIK